MKSKRPTNNPPIVFLQGGPGVNATSLASVLASTPLVENHDLILYDSRGTTPETNFCPELSQELIAIVAKDFNQNQEFQAIQNLSDRCRESLENNDVKFQSFNTRTNVLDLELLRSHLEIERWILLGVSYGSRLGLSYITQYEDNVEAAIFIGLFPPDYYLYDNYTKGFIKSLKKLFSICQEEEYCHSQYPNLKDKTYSLVNSLAESAYEVKHRGKKIVLNPQDVVLILHMMLYSNSTIAQIPSFIYAFEENDNATISGAISIMEHVFLSINYSTFWSVMAYDELPFNKPDAIKRAFNDQLLHSGPAIFISDQRVMQKWHSSRATRKEKRGVNSEVPILMLNGSLDPITPPDNARHLQRNLSNSFFIEFPAEGHSLLTNRCVFSHILKYLDQGYRIERLDCSNESELDWK